MMNSKKVNNNLKETAIFLVTLIFLCTHFHFNEAIDPQQQFSIAGTSFMSDLFDAWLSQFVLQEPNVEINYKEMDSDSALQMLINDTVTMAALDYPIDDETYAQYPDLQIVPVAGTAVVPYFTLLSVGLTLNRATLAAIFMGNITMWNDDRIKATNPSVVFAATQLRVVYRIDDSISTLALTEALSSISPEWKAKYGITRSFPQELRELPNFYGAVGETGAFTRARLLGNAISYLTANAMLHTLNLVQYARMINQNGTRTDLRYIYTKPALDASVSLNLFDEHLAANIADINVPTAYPIMAYSYIAFKKTSTPTSSCSDLAKALEMIAFGINFTAPIVSADVYGYAYLPFSVVQIVRNQLFSVTCNGNVLISTTDTNPAPYVGYSYSNKLETFSGLTTVPYVPFYNYLGSTISASEASSIQLSTISSLTTADPNSSSSSASLLIPSLFIPTLILFFLF